MLICELSSGTKLSSLDSVIRIRSGFEEGGVRWILACSCPVLDLRPLMFISINSHSVILVVGRFRVRFCWIRSISKLIIITTSDKLYRNRDVSPIRRFKEARENQHKMYSTNNTASPQTGCLCGQRSFSASSTLLYNKVALSSAYSYRTGEVKW